jgi:2'-hydroxyisoflavone reductase
VYAGFEQPFMDESAPVGVIEDVTVEQVTGGTYGPLKALCEKAAQDAMPGRACVVRPGLIVGPGDPTDRFTYWPVRVDRGGEVLAPGTPGDPVQFIDVRDLGEFCVLLLERRNNGVFNAVSNPDQFTIGDLLNGCKAATTSDATFTWASADFLEAEGVAPWQHMPVWVPPTGEMAGFGRMSNAAAVGAGLKIRAMPDTCKATLEWFKETQEGRALRAGITPEREKVVLGHWHDKVKQETGG